MNNFARNNDGGIPEEYGDLTPKATPPPPGHPGTKVILKQLEKNSVKVGKKETYDLIGNIKEKNEEAIRLLEKEDRNNPSSKVSNNLGCAYCWREKHTGNLDFANAKKLFYEAINLGGDGSECALFNLGLIRTMEEF